MLTESQRVDDFHPANTNEDRRPQGIFRTSILRPVSKFEQMLRRASGRILDLRPPTDHAF